MSSTDPSALVTKQSKMEMEQARSNQSHIASASELEGLKLQVTECEREKRDLVGVIARLRSEDEERESTCYFVNTYGVQTDVY